MDDTKFWGWVIMLLLSIYFISWRTPYDNTDDIENGIRSGMGLYTDNFTGCQYLSREGYFSSLTPRLDREGEQIGCR